MTRILSFAQTSPAPVAAVAAASVALVAGFFLPVDAYLALVAGVFLVIGTVMALSLQLDTPVVGLLLLIVTAVAFPFEFRGPAGVMMSTSLPLATAICGLWIFRVVAAREAIELDGSRAIYAALTFAVIVVLAFAMGQFPWFSSGGAPLPAQIVELALFLVSIGLFLAVGHQIRSIAHLKWLTFALIAAGVVTTVFQMFPELRFVARWTTRPGSVGSLFWTWLVALCLAQAMLNRRLGVWTRLALVGICGLVLFHGLVQVRSWASGWIPPLAAIGVIALLAMPRVTAVTGIVAVPVALFAATYLSDFLMSDEQYSLMTRQEAWSVLWQLVERSPLLGTGPANYYYFTENFPLLGWYVRFISHNNYQDLLVQTGFLGLIGFLWFSAEMLWMGLRLWARVPAGFPRAYVAGAVGGLVGSLVSGMLGDWIIPFYYNAGILGFRSSLLFWVFLGGLLAMKRILVAAEAADAREPGLPRAMVA